MPDAGAKKNLLGVDMKIKTGRMNILASLVAKMDSQIGFIGSLVFGKSCIAVDPHDRATAALGYGQKVRRHLPQWGFHRGDKLHCREQDEFFVSGLVLREPFAIVVFAQLLKKTKQLWTKTSKHDSLVKVLGCGGNLPDHTRADRLMYRDSDVGTTQLRALYQRQVTPGAERHQLKFLPRKGHDRRKIREVGLQTRWPRCAFLFDR